jgi:hypothetical protein
MHRVGRILTQREWLSVFAQIFRLPAAEFVARVNLQALDAALEAPAAHHRGVAIYASLAEQAAVLTESMLKWPPLPAARRPLAYMTLDLFIEHSGARLEVTAAQRDAFLNETDAAVPSRERLVSWIAGRLREGVAPVSVQTGTQAAPMPMVYVAVPVCAVCDDDDACAHLRSLVDVVRRAVESFAPERGWPGVRLEIAALPYIGGDGPDESELGDEEFNDEVRRLTEVSPDTRLRRGMLIKLRTSDALVIIGGKQPSFGNGNEFARVGSATAVLYLRERESPCSRWLDDEPGFSFLRVCSQGSDPQDVADRVLSWLRDRAGIIEAHWRKRQTRLLRCGPIAMTFAESWAAMPTGRERLEAFASTGLPVDRFHELLSPDGVAGASWDDLEAMSRGLGLSLENLRSIPRARSFVLTSGQRGWLVRFADKTDITREMERALEAEAERQMALGVLRYALTSLDDWYAFAREVARGHLA